jgi:predicted  nucleic acid-binding Zn-ribbon protein
MEKNIEKSLSLLLEIQDVDKQIQQIFQVRGGLPQEVKRLEDDLANLQSQAQNYKDEIVSLEQNISSLRIKIKDIEALVKRYEEQQMNVRNNREYDAITKEIELHKLDIQLAEKKIKEQYEQIERNKHAFQGLDESTQKAKEKLLAKQEDLNSIIGESQEEEQKLSKKRQELESMIDKTLLQTYERIRNRVSNKLAVVLVKGGACGGCFTTVYPQMQAEIKEKRQIYKCEHCGRILADVAESITIISSEEDNHLILGD